MRAGVLINSKRVLVFAMSRNCISSGIQFIITDNFEQNDDPMKKKD